MIIFNSSTHRPCVHLLFYINILIGLESHQSTLTKKLENTQSFACKIITKEWKSDYISLLNKLQLKSLKDRRNIQKLKVCFKIINNKSCIPPSVFSPHPSPSPRHPHSQILFIPHVGTSSHKHSFFLDVIPKWNSLPPEVINQRRCDIRVSKETF